jgi:hypothetical protein
VIAEMGGSGLDQYIRKEKSKSTVRSDCATKSKSGPPQKDGPYNPRKSRRARGIALRYIRKTQEVARLFDLADMGRSNAAPLPKQ